MLIEFLIKYLYAKLNTVMFLREIEREKQEQASIMRQHEERKKEMDASGRPILLSSGRTLSDTGTEVDSNDSVDVSYFQEILKIMAINFIFHINNSKT